MVSLSLHKILQRINIYFSTLNLFRTIPPTTDQFKLRTQKISTYVYIALLLLSLTIFIFYTLNVIINKRYTEKKPDLDKYFELNMKYEESLSCPCTNISIDYGTFMYVEYALNQVCSSRFVTNNWINLIRKLGRSPYIHSNDFRKVGPHLFRALMSSCKQISDTMFRSRLRFYSGQYVSIDLTPSTLLQSRAELIFNRYKSSTINQYLSSLGIMREITAANALFSYLGTDARFYHTRTTGNIIPMPINYDNCSCAVDSSCSSPVSFYSDVEWSVVFTVPGLYIGCYVFEGLLKSKEGGA